MGETYQDLIVVIMAGGTGTRFWPLSTKDNPKQFLNLFGDRTLFQQSFDRVSDIVPPERILVLTNASFVSKAREQLPELPDENIIGEPMKRDTAAAVTLAALLVEKRFGKSAIATLTADHIIHPVQEFHQTLLSAVEQALKGPFFYTFGIQPTYPATGYGYLERGAEAGKFNAVTHYELVRFKEKPNLDIAKRYVDSGRYYWNSGMFVWSSETILNELDTHLSGHVQILREAVKQDKTARWEQALSDAFEDLPKISIDFAVMEKAKNVRCVASRFSWSDVGGWMALEDFLQKDGAGNCVRGQVYSLDAEGNIVFCENSDETVMLVAVKDLVLVHAPAGLLVVPKNRTEDIKKLVEKLPRSKPV